MKKTIVFRKKNKIVKNIKERFGQGEGEEDGEDEEEEKGKAPLELTKSIGEDVEDVHEEEANEAPKGKEKKRKEENQIVDKPKVVPITRSSTREGILLAKEETKEKEREPTLQ